jgi:predicted permease
MDATELRIVFIFVDLILPLIVGYVLKKINRLTAGQCNWLIRFNIIIIFTILSILSFWVMPLRVELIMLPFFGFFCSALPLGIVYLFHLQRKFPGILERGSYVITAIPANIGTMGGLCAFILYGEVGFAYAQMVGVFQNLVMLFVCFPMGYYFKFRSIHQNEPFVMESLNWSSVFINWNQISGVGMLIGIILYVMDVPRPEVLGAVFQALVHIGAWFALVPIGYMIDFSGLKKYYWSTFELAPIKMIITPAICYLIASLFTNDPVLLGSVIILMATPCAINALITVRLYGLNINLSMAPFITTVSLYILVLFPFFYFLVIKGILPFR